VRYAIGAVVRTLYHWVGSIAKRRDTISTDRLRQRWARLPATVRRIADRQPIWIVLNGGEVTQTVTFTRLLHEAVAPVPLVMATSNTYAADFAARHLPWLEATLETPWDIESVCRRALGQARPRALIFIENVYAPVLARTAQRMGIPTILASGLVQTRFRGHPLYTRAFRRRFHEAIALHIVKGDLDAKTLVTELDVPRERVQIGGNLKFDIEFLSRRERVTAITRESLGPDWMSAFVILAGSIHQPEELVIAEAVGLLRRGGHRIRLIVAPRYAAAVSAIGDALRNAGISNRRRTLIASAGEPVPEDALLIDTFGELPGLYALADAVIMGGTFSHRWKAGFGQNIIEPLAALRPVLHGPFISQFEDIRDRMCAVWPGTQVQTAEQLARSIEELITRPELRSRVSSEAETIVRENAGNAQRHVAFIVEHLRAAGRLGP
jgi:3-deoxy-D-manno-octulosonic-acid transferase